MRRQKIIIILILWRTLNDSINTKGVCSRSIEIELDGDTVKSVKFNGGCNGNTQGIAALVKGMKVDEANLPLKRN